MIRAWRRIWPCVCGGAPQLMWIDFPVGEFSAECQQCSRPGPIRPQKEEALRAWNHEMQLLEQGIRDEEQRARKEGTDLH